IQTDNTTVLSSLLVRQPAASTTTGQVQVADLTLFGDLTIDGTNAIFNDGNRNVNVGGNVTLTAGGYYRAGGTNSTLTLNGTGAQALSWNTASAAGTNNLQNLVINKSSGTATVSGTNTALLTGSLTVTTGTLSLTNNLQVRGDVTVNGTVTGAGFIDLVSASATATPQVLSGTGSVTNLRLTGVDGTTDYTVQLGSPFTVVGTVDFTAATADRFVDLLTNRLNITETTTFSNASGTGDLRYLRASGNLEGTSGIRYSVSGAFASGQIPVGVTTRFTPVSYTGTATTDGSILVRPIGSVASFHTDALVDSALAFHWVVAAQDGLVLTDLTHTYTYADVDLRPDASAEADYQAALFLTNGGSSWTTDPGFTVTTGTNTLTFDNFLDINATYSAGSIDELGAVATYYTRNDAPGITTGVDFATIANWSVDAVLQHAGAAAPNAPDPSTLLTGGAGRARVADTHIINLTTTNTELFSLEIVGPTGEFRIGGGSFGNNVSSISGGGVFEVTGIVPTSDYTGLIDTTTGGTFRFAGTSNYTLPGTDRIPYYRNVQITGSGTRTVPATGLDINGNLTITGGTLDIPAGRTVYVKGNLSVTGTGDITGTGTLILDGNATQTLTLDEVPAGATLRIRKTGGNIQLGSNLTVNGTLNWGSNALILPNGNTLTFGTAGSAVGAGPNRYVAGAVSKLTASTAAFSFPIGSGGYLPIEISPTTSSTNTWTAQYIVGATTTPLSTTAAQNFNNDLPQDIVSGYYWEINSADGDDAQIRMTWSNPISFSAPLGDIVVLSTDDPNNVASVWVSEGGENPLPVSSDPATAGSIQASRATAFSSPAYFAFGSIGGSLPVELLAFTGTREGQEARLRWTTASEINNDRFEVQRSLDGLRFETIGFVSGSGTTDAITNYSFTDFETPAEDRLYYRLRQVDFDGKFSYSPIIELGLESSSGQLGKAWAVAPNPVVGDDFGLVLLTAELDPLRDRHNVTLVTMSGAKLVTVRGTLNEVNRELKAIMAKQPGGNYLVNVAAKSFTQQIRVLKR
ncbi:MAG: hypothetical protein SFY70_10660, partial [Bacteroidia bacterium]|nr:hypothetical protein [Bacteroidia bacterium]